MKNKLIEFIKFSMSSLGSTVVDLGLFWILVFFLRDRMPHQAYIFVATVIARIASLLVNYNINAKVVFKDEGRTFPFVKYISLAIADMLASALLVTILFDYLHWNETLVKMLVDGSLFFVGYYIQQKYVF